MKTAILAIAIAACGSAFASEPLAQDKQCLQCHAIRQEGAGPSFQRIAAQWKGRPDAVARLAAVARQGSGDGQPLHWGRARMPDDSERPLVSEAEGRQLARWILRQ